MQKSIRSSIIVVVFITICAVWIEIPNRGCGTVDFADIGQGDGALITTSGGRRILIDAGPRSVSNPTESAMKKYLIQRGISKIDVIVLSHYHDDHYGGIIGIAKEFTPELILLPKPINEENQKVADEIAAQISKETVIIYMKMGESFELGNEVNAEAIFRSTESSDENDRTLVLAVKCKNTKFLFTGDMTMKGEEKILQEISADKLKANVVKVAHHGSKYSSSTEFYEVASPEYAVICVGKNMYGHPTQEALDRISQTSQIMRTDKQGAIEFVIDDSGIKKIRER